VNFHALATPAAFLRLASFLAPASLATFLLCGSVGAVWGLFLAPADYQQGDSVRIMYVHVPAAWSALAAYAFMALASLCAVIWRHPVAALLARGAATPGAVCTLIALVSGAIWGKPMGGAWWVWGDARLISMLILLFFYIGYIALWEAHANPARAIRPTSILCLAGALNLPVVKFSVDWWSTLHQPASVLRLDGPTIHPSMLWPLLVMAVATLAYVIATTSLSTRARICDIRIAALRTAGASARSGR